MRQIKINGVTYDFDALDDEVKKQLRYLSFIDSELERMTMHISTLKLAREGVSRFLDLAMARHALGNSTPEKSQDAPDTGLAG